MFALSSLISHLFLSPSGTQSPSCTLSSSGILLLAQLNAASPSDTAFKMVACVRSPGLSLSVVVTRPRIDADPVERCLAHAAFKMVACVRPLGFSLSVVVARSPISRAVVVFSVFPSARLDVLFLAPTLAPTPARHPRPQASDTLFEPSGTPRRQGNDAHRHRRPQGTDARTALAPRKLRRPPGTTPTKQPQPSATSPSLRPYCLRLVQKIDLCLVLTRIYLPSWLGFAIGN
ncbi:hypothetical protein B0H19DRAFT_1367121 [Mycena capillaripes]|nr:hypothetical protein B0H19DRAFT_1367121 [Mycena capillaripes]